MSENVRIIGGYIEVNYERMAKLLPGKDERDVKQALSFEDESFDRGYECGARAQRERFRTVITGLKYQKKISEKAFKALMEARLHE